MRSALSHARTNLRTAEEDLQEAQERLIAAGVDYPTMTPAQREEWEQVNAALNAARRQHERALRDYETTPAGQRDLADAAARLDADGDHAGAERARQRLAEAKAIRQQQVADLAASREYDLRMQSLTPEESDAILGVDAARVAADRTLREAEDRLEDRQEMLRDYRAVNRRALAIDGSPEQEEEHRLALAVKQAQMEVEDAEHAFNAACDRQQKSRALIGCNVSLDATPVDLATAGHRIVRQPDGTVNAYVYRAPSPGFPNGRYLRATGVTVVWGTSPGNALVLEDGSKVYAREFYSRNHLGLQHNVNPEHHVVITPAQPGARPLREEGDRLANYSMLIDSTD